MLIDQALDILWHFHILLDIMGTNRSNFEHLEILSETEMNPLH